MKNAAVFFIVALTAFLLQPVHAQSTTTTTTTTSAVSTAPGITAADAVGLAANSVDPSLRDRVVSVYGVGTPAQISSWWVIFYDPSVPSHGRAVKIDNGQVTRTYEAKGGVIYHRSLTFPREWVTAEGAALNDAQTYAQQHSIAYDHVRALLRLTAEKQNLRWRVELMNSGANQGFVFVNANDGSYAMYAPPGGAPSASSSSTGGVVGDAEHLGNDVKKTFLGIGGDLQQFFTGERTVDQ